MTEKIQVTDAVVLLGYKMTMIRMIASNSGLSRRFPFKDAITIQTNNELELLKMFCQNCLEKNCKIFPGEEVENKVLKVLEKQRVQPNFDEAKAIEMIVQRAADKAALRSEDENWIEILPEDVQFDDPVSCLKSLYKLDGIKQHLTEMMNFLIVSRAEGSSLPDVGHFVFRGSPGTGKTTVGRLLANILYKIGFLAKNHLEEWAGNNFTL